MKFKKQILPTMIAAAIAANTSATQAKLKRLIGAPIGSAADLVATLMRVPRNFVWEPRPWRLRGKDKAGDAICADFAVFGRYGLLFVDSRFPSACAVALLGSSSNALLTSAAALST